MMIERGSKTGSPRERNPKLAKCLEKAMKEKDWASNGVKWLCEKKEAKGSDKIWQIPCLIG